MRKKGYKIKPWTHPELKKLSQHLHLTDKQLGEMFGRPATAVEAARMRHGLVKSKDQWNWQKGNQPWNKGIKYNAGGKSIDTRFKKGQAPPNAFRNIGDVFTIVDGQGKPYQFIKLKHNRQYPYGRYVWEQHHGQDLLKSEVIRFKDGNPANCSIENILKVSRSENVRMNSNREKASEEMKKTWAVIKTFEDFGLTPPYKLRSKRKRA